MMCHGSLSFAGKEVLPGASGCHRHVPDRLPRQMISHFGKCIRRDMLGAFDTDVEENSLYLSQIFDNIQTGKAAVKDELDLPVCNHVKKIMNRFDDEDIL
jgi:hypothetical protein